MRLADTLIDLLYPPRCPICHDLVPKGKLICPECVKRLPVIETRRCRTCGKPVEETEVFCESCRSGGHSFTEGFGLFLYDETMKRSISYLKYKRRREYGERLGMLLYLGTRDLIRRWQPELVIPVPLHASRYRERGYNQAALLAAPVAAGHGIPIAEDVLLRIGKTDVMKNLSREEHRKNLEGVFQVKNGVHLPERILLVDDIYTTGATIDACADCLRRCGVKQVFFLTLCTGGGFLKRF